MGRLRHFRSWAAPISRSSAARPRSRRRGWNASRTSISTISIPNRYGSSASAISGRCWSRWIATAGAFTTPCAATRKRAVPKCCEAWASNKMTIRRIATDVLILGAGGAGLFAALHAHQANPALSITIAVKGLLGKCGCTRMVQGGYNVALAAGDSVEKHFQDTIEGGAWLADQDLAWTLVTHAVTRVRELENELG